MEKEELKKNVEMKAAEMKEQFSEKFSETVGTAGERGRNAAEKAVQGARDIGVSVNDAVQEHLLPILLIGMGAAWLTAALMRRHSESASEAGPESAIRETASGFGEKAKQFTQRARESSLKRKDKSKAIATKNPFYLAGALAGIGMLIGMSFPETRQENRIYDEMRKGAAEEQEARPERR
ncbi:MAG: hypothetical protein R6U50_18345 [Desulfobacterales bacterium]